eukprot:g404.t1
MMSVGPELVREGGVFAGFRSWSGGVQGFPLLPAFFCVGLHPHLHRAQVRLKEHASWAVVRAQMDDAGNSTTENETAELEKALFVLLAEMAEAKADILAAMQYPALPLPRHRAAGGVRPLVFGQYGEFGSGLQTLLDELALAGAAEAAERYLLESSVAAAAVQKRLLRQRLVCCVAQAQADVLLSRLHLCLPG